MAVMILVYGDESMDETQQRVCAVAGVFGSELAWQEIERKWIERTGGIPFHAKNCDSDFRDYAAFSHAENKVLYRDLAIMLAESDLSGYGHAINLAAMRRVFPESEELAYYRGFISIMDLIVKTAYEADEVAELTFDMRLESEHNAGLLYGQAREHDPDWQAHLVRKIAFEFSRDNPRLQVADLMAREAMKALDNESGPVRRPPRKSWIALQQTGRFEVEAYSYEWFYDLKRNYANLEKRLGYSRQDYIDWLKERNRQDNVTAKFQFVDWATRRNQSPL